MKKVNVIGAGLAGVEAAHFLASHGVHVDLYEMRPHKMTPAHHSGKFAELVCSNSLKSINLDNACGLLKEEMRIMNSLVMESALLSRVPAGNSLSVDREAFSSYIDENIRKNPNISIHNEEIERIPSGVSIIATGPLTSDALTKDIITLTGIDTMAFFDASAPIIYADSINYEVAYKKSRYDQDEGSYINCPFTKDEYYAFYNALISADKAPIHSFDTQYFEGCMPIEVMAARGDKTLLFGPLKPVGLERDDSSKPFAIVQLRQDDLLSNLYSLVGFQTNLTYREQERVFHLIPGLEKARFVRYGLMHRNSYVLAPKVLNADLSLKNNDEVFIAGQLSGVEGYVESAATGIIAGINAYRKVSGLEDVPIPTKSVIGALLHYISKSSYKSFAPMNANFGIIYGATKDNRQKTINEALDSIKTYWETVNE